MSGAVRASANDPYRAFRFKVKVDDAAVGGFQEASGLEAEVEPFEFREGGVNEHLRRLAGPTKHAARLILKRGLGDAKFLWDWHRDVVSGKIVRKDVIVVQTPLSNRQETRWQWRFEAAYPVKWNGPSLQASENQIAFESLELTHRGITLAG